MNTPSPWYAVGYLFIFAPPVVLMAGQAADFPLALFALIFIVGPFLRMITGNMGFEAPEWGETAASILHVLPALAGVAGIAGIAGSVWLLEASPWPSTWVVWAYGLSLWTALLCLIPLAHELLHRKGVERELGALLSGVAGYPFLEGEHLRHHAMSGPVHVPEWPRVQDSMWRYVGSKFTYAAASAWTFHMTAARNNLRSVLRFALALTGTAVTACAFYWAADTTGLIVYLVAAFGIHFSVHALNYVQHWGLGVDSVGDADEARYGWECRCALQGWLFLNIALHHTHHQRSALPYYRLTPDPLSPKLPGNYIVLLFLSMVPPAWRWVMMPALEQWKQDPANQQEPKGSRILCLPSRPVVSGTLSR